MTDVLFTARQVMLVTTASICSVITVMILVILPRTMQRKFPPSETPCHHNLSCSHSCYNCNCKDRSQSFHHRHRENASTGQGNTTNLNVTEAPATNVGTPPTPYPFTTAAHDSHPLTDVLGDTLVGTPLNGTTTTHPWHDALHARATLATMDCSQSSSRHA